MKNLRKIIAILLAVTLLLPATALARDEKSLNAVTEETLAKVKQLVSNREIDLSKFAKGTDKKIELNQDTDKVRIIVQTDVKEAASKITRTASGNKFSKAYLDQVTTVNARNEKVLSNLKSKGIAVNAINKFNTVFSGFSATVKKSQLDAVKRTTGVSNVFLSTEYKLPIVKPDMGTSHTIINNRTLWETGLDVKGQGRVVAIMDTGIDANHKDFQSIDTSKTKLKKADVESVIAANPSVKGLFLTDKVPFSYNYFDNSLASKDMGPDASMHGMHVAGTVAANGDPAKEASGESVIGVAPQAQLLNMKVFGNDAVYSTTYTDIYMKAIEDALLFKVDAVNLSLGSPAGTNIPDDPLNQSVTKAVENGIDFSISAGNSSHTFYGYQENYGGLPFEEDPDFGVVGSPSVANDSTSIASFENTSTLRTIFEITSLNADGTTSVDKFPYVSSSPVSPIGMTGNKDEIVFLGTGSQQEYDDYLATGASLEGKIVLVMRGQTFTETQARSQEKGAKLHIVFNHENGGDGLVSMMTNSGQTIPNVFITHEAGLKILEDTAKSFSVLDKKMQTPNPQSGYMSEFSSWGSSPSLEIKPELTAPGGNIYSTVNYNKYETMSGTSMAAPHVSGGFALVRQLLDQNKEKYGDLTPAQQSRLAKVLLMNNTNILTHPEYEVPFSVRQQGAGGMDLSKIVDTTLTAVDSTTKEAKVELKELSSPAVNMTLELKNLTDESQEYLVDLTSIKDFTTSGFNTMSSDLLSTDFNSTSVTLNPRETKNLSVSFNVTEDLNNQFIEGWVHLTSTKDGHVVNVPFMGFMGDWSAPRVLDTLRLGEKTDGSPDDSKPYYGIAGMWHPTDSGINYYSEEKNAISPATEDGKKFGTDSTLPVLSFLRNSKMLNIKLLNESKEQIGIIAKESDITKSYFNQGLGKPFIFDEGWIWDGTTRTSQVADGKYYLEFETMPYATTKSQKMLEPVYVDTVKPVIEDLSYADGQLTVKATDEGTGLLLFDVMLVDLNSEEIMSLKEIPHAANTKTSNQDEYKIDVSEFVTALGPDGMNNHIFVVLGYDHAMNQSEEAIESLLVSNYEIPWLYVISPDLLEGYNTKEVPLTGYLIDDEDSVITYTVNDKAPVEVPTKAATDLQVSYGKEDSELRDGYTFEDPTMLLDEGYNLVKVRAQAVFTEGKETTVSREVFVDTIKPSVNLISYDVVAPKGTEAKVKIKVAEQLPYFEVYANGEKVAIYDNYQTMRGDNTIDLEYEFPVFVYDDGEYLVKIVVKDSVGNVSDELQIIINKTPEDIVGYVIGGLNVRQEPNSSSTILGSLPNGKIVDGKEVLGNPNWVEIVYNGSPAYVWIGGLSDTEIPFEGYTLGTVNVRDAAGMSGKVVKSLQVATKITGTIDPYNTNWIKFQLDGKTVWIAKSVLTKQVPKTSGTLPGKVNVRTLPSTNGEIMGSLPAGTFVEGKLAEANHKWLEIYYLGQKAYIWRGFVK